PPPIATLGFDGGARHLVLLAQHFFFEFQEAEFDAVLGRRLEGNRGPRSTYCALDGAKRHDGKRRTERTAALEQVADRRLVRVGGSERHATDFTHGADFSSARIFRTSASVTMPWPFSHALRI